MTPSPYKDKLLKEIEEFPEGKIPKLYRFIHILRVELMQKTKKPMVRGSLKGIWKGSHIEEASFIRLRQDTLQLAAGRNGGATAP